jgi:hypothetical protein
VRNKASILDSSAASRLFSCRSCSVSFLSCYGFAGLRLHSQLVLHLALLVIQHQLLVTGIASPVERRAQVARRIARTQ